MEKFVSTPPPGDKDPQQKKEALGPELEAVLEQVDFKALEDMFRQRIASLGLDPEAAHFVPYNEISDMTKLGNFRGQGGVYKEEDKKIQLSHPLIKHVTKIRSLEENSPSYTESVVSMLCHEETHAVSGQECEEWKSTVLPFVEKRERNIGFMQKPANRIGGKVVMYPEKARFVMFNEGVTDMIGEEIYHAYSDTKSEAGGLELEQYLALYTTGRKLVSAVLEKISDECDLPPELVWRALQRGYFAGDDLGNETIHRLFDQVAPEALFENVKNADGSFSLNIPMALMRIKKSIWTDDSRIKIRRWFKHVDALMKESEIDQSIK